MALRAKSLFLYGYEVGPGNCAIDFRVYPSGPLLQATIPSGYYSLTGLLSAISSQMRAASGVSISVSADRSVNGGTENRITFTTLGTHFSIYFGTGPRKDISIAELLGFAKADLTGGLTYTGTSTSGTALIPDWWGKNYQPPELFKKNFGAVNVSTSGDKEAIVFAIQEFLSVQFDFESETKAFNEWPGLIGWMIKQRVFDFTPEISNPGVFYEVTLEKTSEDGKGLGFNLKEQVPQYPFMFSTGPMTFRRRGVF